MLSDMAEYPSFKKTLGSRLSSCCCAFDASSTMDFQVMWLTHHNFLTFTYLHESLAGWACLCTWLKSVNITEVIFQVICCWDVLHFDCLTSFHLWFLSTAICGWVILYLVLPTTNYSRWREIHRDCTIWMVCKGVRYFPEVKGDTIVHISSCDGEVQLITLISLSFAPLQGDTTSCFEAKGGSLYSVQK